jgi:transcriptional regulator with XRE-family HTH domain
MATSQETPSLLGEQIARRLAQLGISRRELCKHIHLSRQTLHRLEYEMNRHFARSTFEILDKGLRWPIGTAEAYHSGIANAKDLKGGWTTEELVNDYVASILRHVASMSIEELEREVLLLESEAYGRELTDDADALAVITETVNRLANAIINGPNLTRKK